MSGNLISDRGVAQLRADHQKLQQLMHRHQLMNSAPAYQSPREDQILVKVTTMITPKASGQLGEGIGTVYDIDSTGAITETSRDDIEIYNISTVPIPVDAFVMCRRNFKSGIWLADEPQTAIAKSNGISGRSGTTAGSGTASIYYLDGSTLTDTSHDLTVYNIADATIASGAWITIKRNANGSYWYVDMEACG
tara:strand:- start:1868 stop:2446 length:579 start_codon:yes stop_codon:yes gene_type:complete